MIDWAAWYAKQGLEVFPVYRIRDDGTCSCGHARCNSPGKHPIIGNGVRGASSDLGLVQDRWGLNPKANIGVHTNSLAVLDVDGEEGVASLDAICSRRHGARDLLLRSPMSQTGSGGMHFFFRNNPDGSIRNKVKFLPGLDIRSEGGYVVVPPSNHVSGKRYQWVRRPAEVAPKFFPSWLKEEISNSEGRNRLPLMKANGEARASIDLSKIGEITEGGRNQGLTRICGRLFWEGRGENEIRSLMKTINQMACKPPVSDGELESIYKNIKSKEMRKHRE